MSWQDTLVSMVQSANRTTPSNVPIGSILVDIQRGRWAEQAQKIRAVYAEVCAEKGPKAAKDAVAPLKKKLPGFTASGIFVGRRANENWSVPSGLLCVDLDGLGDRVVAVRATLAGDPHTWRRSATSPSGSGLKVILRIQPDPGLRLRSFKAARLHFRGARASSWTKAAKMRRGSVSSRTTLGALHARWRRARFWSR